MGIKFAVNFCNYKFTYNTDNAAAGTTKYQVKTAEYAQYAQLYDFSYDKHGNVTQTKQHNKNNTTATVMQSNATYSANGDKQLTATNELRNTTSYGYSATCAKDLRVYNVHNGNSTVYYGYLPGSNTVSKTSVKATGLNGTVQEHIASYAYQNNRLTGITHNGFNYTLGYDGFGNRTVTKVGSRTLVTNAYGANNGLLQSSTYGNGAKVENVYDRLDRVTAVKINGAEKYRYTYNANNQLAVFTDVALNKTTRYTYDLLGRLLRSDCSDGSVQQYTYNNVDNTTGKRYTYNGQTKSFGYTYQKGGIGETTTYPNGASRKQFLGHLAQVCKSTLTLPGGNTSTVEYGLYSPAEGFSSSAIGSVRYGQLNRSFVYSYTPQGNISAVCDGDRQSTYQYDEINQLIRENNAYLNKTVTYSYDAGGNILSKTAYPYTTGSLEGQTGETVTYSYGDSEWKDLLTAYNGQAITYDAIGNPLSYKNGFTFTWQNGRRLATAAANGKALSFAYNESGIRTQKTVDGVTTEYYLDGSTVLAQKTGNNTVWYYYDCNGTREALEYGGQVYYYLYNAQGDVMALYDNDLNIVTEYTYNSWGKLLSVTGSLAETVGKANPFRYRGYYYDAETELYYLNSRYYDPETGRFISGDGELSGVGETSLGYNLFSYCQNSPINMDDSDGNWPRWAKKLVAAVAVVAVVAVVAAITVATAGAGTAAACIAIGAAKGAAVGFAIGAATGAATAAVKHRIKNKTWKGAGKAALEGGASGALTGSITGAITGGLGSKVCFIAGTPVLASVGHVSIENIKAGDRVWSENPETGEKELKEVVRTFVNETHELVHVYANGEKIVTTPEHPFYVPSKGWVEAICLRAGDILVFQNGEYGIVEKIQHELLEHPIKVYNFEVTDFHTYYVGKSSILVHNVCGVRNTPDQNAVIKLAKEFKKGVSKTDANTLVGWAKEYGLNYHEATVHIGRSGIWGTVEHIKIFNIHIPIVK